MPLSPRHERGLTLLSSAGLRATPFRWQGDVLQHRGELPLIMGTVEPPVETAAAQLRILRLARRQ